MSGGSSVKMLCVSVLFAGYTEWAPRSTTVPESRFLNIEAKPKTAESSLKPVLQLKTSSPRHQKFRTLILKPQAGNPEA